jgi:hypothetical protein
MFPPEVILGIFNAVAPIVKDIVAKHLAVTGAMPTDAEVTAAFNQNIDTYLAEGAAWRAAHPNA